MPAVNSVLHPDGSLTIWLPLPAREVSPNAVRGQSKWAALKKSKAVKRHRSLARMLAVDALARHGLAGKSFGGYALAFFFKTAAFRDDDNADASAKSYRDGVAEALRMNDRDLKKCRLSVMAKDAVNPRLEMTIFPNVLAHAPGANA